MNRKAGDNWQVLLDAGLVSGNPPESPPPGSPWYVRLMLGFAGWLAAIFLIGFFAAVFHRLFQNEALLISIGVILMALSSMAFRKLPDNDFAEQFALAISFAGQFMVTFGIFELYDVKNPETAPWWLIALIQAALVVLMPNATHRLWSAFAAAVAVALTLHTWELGFIAYPLLLALAAWTWLNEFRWPQYSSVLRLVAYGLVVAMFTSDMADNFFRPFIGFGSAGISNAHEYAWAGQLLGGLILLWVSWRLLREQAMEFPGKTANAILGGALLLVLVSLEAPGIAAGVCVILLGFSQGNHRLTGIGIAALLLYAGHYYYALEVTLLVKSQVLAATGLTLLLVRWLFNRLISPDSGSGSGP